jgi:alkanesulfonate monooxygenase SsuD/methylene tetrahydromethanopterin reductase-like flavin-dependent oxidoreductase (luciferase family)
VLVGGGGERKTLRLVATYADACNLFAVSPDVVRHKLDVLRGHCEAVGRDPATVRRTILYVAPLGEPTAFLAAMEDYARLGVDEVILVPGPERPDGWIDRVAAPLVGPLADLHAAW